MAYERKCTDEELFEIRRQNALKGAETRRQNGTSRGGRPRKQEKMTKINISPQNAELLREYANVYHISIRKTIDLVIERANLRAEIEAEMKRRLRDFRAETSTETNAVNEVEGNFVAGGGCLYDVDE